MLKGDPAPRTLNPPLTQHFSTSGRGHKGFPTWITAPSPALDDSTKVLAEPGVGWGWGTQGTSTGQERDQLAPQHVLASCPDPQLLTRESWGKDFAS